ncbi:MAG: regulatory iron-sulfur-containing complex subunit RicT [Gemmatimonadales bacterium]
MPQVIEVRFKGARKEYYTWESDTPPAVGQAVVVVAERGEDLGHVSAVGDHAQLKCAGSCNGCDQGQPNEPKAKVLRAASEQDANVSVQLRKAEEDVRRKVMERVKAHDLTMKVSDAEWQWDRKKLTVYFTAEKRVDFRALVRDLASLFRTRIDLRQIGARDEAKRLDGVGRCGRQYCCSSWLPELRPVSLSLAKDQRLSLNPSQISGGCGRLLCCLRYEHDFYVTMRKRFPKEGRVLRTAAGSERVETVDIFRERVLLRAEDGTFRSLALAELREEIAAPDHAPEKVAQPPSSLVTFDAKDEPVTTEKAVESVAPPPPTRRRKRRRNRGRRHKNGNDTNDPKRDDKS